MKFVHRTLPGLLCAIDPARDLAGMSYRDSCQDSPYSQETSVGQVGGK
jgi:hypothetical protein